MNTDKTSNYRAAEMEYEPKKSVTFKPTKEAKKALITISKRAKRWPNPTTNQTDFVNAALIHFGKHKEP